jgi:hypothetical protein
LPLCGCRRHPQCKPRSTFRLEMCQPMAPVLPVSERKLRHVAVWRAAPRQATTCQYLVTVVPGAKHKGMWRLIPMSAFQGESAHHNSAASYRPGVGDLLRQMPRLFGLGAKNTFYTHLACRAVRTPHVARRFARSRLTYRDASVRAPSRSKCVLVDATRLPPKSPGATGFRA